MAVAKAAEATTQEMMPDTTIRLLLVAPLYDDLQFSNVLTLWSN